MPVISHVTKASWGVMGADFPKFSHVTRLFLKSIFLDVINLLKLAKNYGFVGFSSSYIEVADFAASNWIPPLSEALPAA